MALRAPVPASSRPLRDLGRRSLSGTIGHVALIGFIQLWFPTSHGLSGASIAAIFGGFFLLRMTGLVIAHFELGTVAQRWAVVASASIGMNLVWGVLVASVHYRASMGEVSIVLAFMLCGIATGGVTALAPSFAIQTAALSVLVLPVVILGLCGYGTASFAVLHAMFYVFTLVLGVVACREYRATLATADRLHAYADTEHAAAVAAAEVNVQLRGEIDHRLRVEIELREAQKLEAIGRLAAGIAHEINTPIQFVTDSCQFLSEGIGELCSGVDAYRGLLADRADAVAALDADLDLRYLRDQLPAAATRAIEGLDRVARIVRATKEFAYPHQLEKSLANLNRAIESTLVMAHNESKFVADTEFAPGNIPDVLCHCGELNQVLLNLIVNATHAIGDKYAGSARKGKISIVTQMHGASAVDIVIADDGAGIAPAVMDKIFEPFFTTKPVGKGTGQGLAIARSVVVDKHGGTLDVTSQVDIGTTFTITLPVG